MQPNFDAGQKRNFLARAKNVEWNNA